MRFLNLFILSFLVTSCAQPWVLTKGYEQGNYVIKEITVTQTPDGGYKLAPEDLKRVSSNMQNAIQYNLKDVHASGADVNLAVKLNSVRVVDTINPKIYGTITLIEPKTGDELGTRAVNYSNSKQAPIAGPGLIGVLGAAIAMGIADATASENHEDVSVNEFAKLVVANLYPPKPTKKTSDAAAKP